jgi:hypothetical protein
MAPNRAEKRVGPYNIYNKLVYIGRLVITSVTARTFCAGKNNEPLVSKIQGLFFCDQPMD